MCTSGIMYELEEDEVEIAEEVNERVCNYSGLLSIREYQLIQTDDE